MLPDPIINLFHCAADNVGDRMSGPAQYFWPHLCRNLPLGSKYSDPATKVIIGGGQIFSQLNVALTSIVELNPKVQVIAWGVGLPPKGKRDEIVSQTAKSFAAFGTRNYDRRDEFPFVPCASCLSPLFDQIRAPQHEFVVYLHRKKDGPLNVPLGVPTLTNGMRPPREAIDFIASGATVVTSSYHGVYWAQLLGRAVICIPYNDKFKTFQHPPMVTDPDRWLESIRVGAPTEPLLQEYRELNHNFAQRALEIWNG